MSIPRNKLCSPCNLILMMCFPVTSFGSESLLVVEILTHVMAQNSMWKLSTLLSVSAQQNSFTHSLSSSGRKTLDCLQPWVISGHLENGGKVILIQVMVILSQTEPRSDVEHLKG